MARRQSTTRIQPRPLTLAQNCSRITALCARADDVTPPLNANAAPTGAPISVTFDQPVLRASVTTTRLRAFGHWTDSIAGAVSFSNGDRTVALTPSRPLSAGDQITVAISNALRAANGEAIRPAGYAWIFRTRTAEAGLLYAEVDTMSNRSLSNAQTRIYGGFCTDLDNDGWLDITTVNEVSRDLRVFMNKADSSGFHPFLEPPRAIGVEASPNDSADFNNDGFADAVTANFSGQSLSLVLGAGNGTFQPQTLLAVGTGPAGVVAIDVDADGDTDIVNSNNSTNQMSILLNNGSGVFGPAAFFNSGGNGEYGLATADMNEDGILDVVAGCRDGQEVAILLGNGVGGFTTSIVRTGFGSIWQVNAADLNGDGHADVATGNSASATGSIAFGDGAGGLSASSTAPISPCSSAPGAPARHRPLPAPSTSTATAPSAAPTSPSMGNRRLTSRRGSQSIRRRRAAPSPMPNASSAVAPGAGMIWSESAALLPPNPAKAPLESSISNGAPPLMA